MLIVSRGTWRVLLIVIKTNIHTIKCNALIISRRLEWLYVHHAVIIVLVYYVIRVEKLIICKDDIYLLTNEGYSERVA